MTVTASRESRVIVSNTGFANPIDLDQYVESATHVEVYAVVGDAAGDPLSVGVDYSIAGIGDNDGIEVTLLAPALAIDDVTDWVVFHNPPLDQGADLSLGGRFGLAFEQALDATVRRLQSIADKLTRSVSLSVASPLDVEPLEIPLPVAGRSWKWDPTATLLISTSYDPDVGGDLSDAADRAELAALAAEAAAGSLAEMSYPYLNAAIAGTPTTQFVRVRGIAAEGDYGGIDAVYKYTASTPAHTHYFTAANGRKYVRVPPAPGEPCSVAELGLLPNQGIGVNCTPALNAIIAVGVNGGCKTWSIPTGQYHFNTVPNDIVTPGMSFEGPAVLSTLDMRKNFVSTVGTKQGIFNFRAGQFNLKRLRCVALAGSQGAGPGYSGTGCFISVVSSLTSGAIGYFEMDDIEVTSDVSIVNGDSCLACDIFMDGSANDGSTTPWVRGGKLSGLKLFGAQSATLYMISCAGIYASGQGTFNAGGATGRIIMEGSVTTPIAECRVDLAANSNGVLFSGYASNCMVTAAEFSAGVISFSNTNVHGCLTVGSLANGATLVNSSLNSAHIDPRMPQIVETGSTVNGRWRKFSDGRIEQWGPCSTSAGTGTLTFAKAFATAVHSLQVASKDDPGANNVAIAQAHTVTLSGAALICRVLTTAPGSAAVSHNLTYFATGF